MYPSSDTIQTMLLLLIVAIFGFAGAVAATARGFIRVGEVDVTGGDYAHVHTTINFHDNNRVLLEAAEALTRLETHVLAIENLGPHARAESRAMHGLLQRRVARMQHQLLQVEQEFPEVGGARGHSSSSSPRTSFWSLYRRRHSQDPMTTPSHRHTEPRRHLHTMKHGGSPYDDPEKPRQAGSLSGGTTSPDSSGILRTSDAHMQLEKALMELGDFTSPSSPKAEGVSLDGGRAHGRAGEAAANGALRERRELGRPQETLLTMASGKREEAQQARTGDNTHSSREQQPDEHHQSLPRIGMNRTLSLRRSVTIISPMMTAIPPTTISQGWIDLHIPNAATGTAFPREKRQIFAAAMGVLGVVSGAASLFGVGVEASQIAAVADDVARLQEDEDVIVNRIGEDEHLIEENHRAVQVLREAMEETIKINERENSIFDVMFAASEQIDLMAARHGLWTETLLRMRQGKFPLSILGDGVYARALHKIRSLAAQRDLKVDGDVYDPAFTIVPAERGLHVIAHIPLRVRRSFSFYAYAGAPLLAENATDVHIHVNPEFWEHKVLVTNGAVATTLSSTDLAVNCPPSGRIRCCKRPLVLSDKLNSTCLGALYTQDPAVHHLCQFSVQKLKPRVVTLDNDSLLLMGNGQAHVACARTSAVYDVVGSLVVDLPRGCNFSAFDYHVYSVSLNYSVMIPPSTPYLVPFALNLTRLLGQNFSDPEVEEALKRLGTIRGPALISIPSLRAELLAHRQERSSRHSGLIIAIMAAIALGIALCACSALCKEYYARHKRRQRKREEDAVRFSRDQARLEEGRVAIVAAEKPRAAYAAAAATPPPKPVCVATPPPTVEYAAISDKSLSPASALNVVDISFIQRALVDAARNVCTPTPELPRKKGKVVAAADERLNRLLPILDAQISYLEEQEAQEKRDEDMK